MSDESASEVKVRPLSPSPPLPLPSTPKYIETKKPIKRKKAVDENGFRIRRSRFNTTQTTTLGSDNITHIDPDSEVGKIEDEQSQGAKYIFDKEKGLRRVTPYFFTHMTFCKQRWMGRTLLDIFTSEFRDRKPEYYKAAIEKGLVSVNYNQASLDTIIKGEDVITNRIHKHEPPITIKPFKIVHEDDEVIIIDKPCGMPAHPTGRYRFNTFTMIMQQELGIKAHPCNRLDRLTSGLMIIAKTSVAFNKIAKQIREREVQKEYIARVIGEFPLGEITVNQPLETIDFKLTLNRTKEGGKESTTIFRRISFDGVTSIVKCKPITGRTHQIRVHLQYIGYPIANDPIYSNVNVWGPELGKNGAGDDDEIREKLDKIGKTEASSSWFYPNESGGELLSGETCDECDYELYSDPNINNLGLWLHAYKYYSEIHNWSYQTDIPEWAFEGDRKFMELALEQAKKCAPTKTAFSVGAVLVLNGNILSSGYSRELPGNTHAEECALEKYFTKTGERKVPPGTVIYTTMEPCSERLSGNLPCTNRILDTNIITCFVGVVEPDTFIKNNIGLQRLQNKGIHYIKIPGYEKECLETARKGHDD